VTASTTCRRGRGHRRPARRTLRDPGGGAGLEPGGGAGLGREAGHRARCRPDRRSPVRVAGQAAAVADAVTAPEAATPPGPADSPVTLHLLGPVEFTLGGRVVGAGPPMQRAILAALAMDRRFRISRETLVRRVWDEPPAAARGPYTHIARIRRRSAEALELYAATRHRLAGSLGAGPGARLSAMHVAVLRNALAAPPGGAAA
jgi:hypothetical protein